MTVDQVRAFLQRRGSPMAGETGALARVAQREGVPLAYVLGIAGAESEFGTTGYAKGRHNPYGYGIHQGYDYPSYAAATQAMLKGIKSSTYKGANTIGGIASIYAPTSENDTARYAQNVARIASMFGGNYDPSSVVIGKGNASVPMVGGGDQAASDTSANVPSSGGLDPTDYKVQMLSAISGMRSPDPWARLSALLTVKNLRTQGAGGGDSNTVPAGGVGQNASLADISGAIPGSPIAGMQPHSATHETAGLAGYPAYDYMAPAGTPTVAPATGRIIRLSGKDPSLGGPPGGALGYSIYLQGGGKSYFLTHLDKLRVKAGQRVRQGQQIAQVAAGPASWSSPHVHMGVRG